MPPRPATIATVFTPHGPVVVKKAWARKQATFVAVLDGTPQALQACLPRRTLRPTSTRIQVTPDHPIDLCVPMEAWIIDQVPAWTRAACGETAPTGVPLVTLKDALAAAEKTMTTTVRASTIVAYKKQWNRILRHLPQRTSLATITRERVQTLVGALAAEGYATTTIRSAITALHRGLAPALDAGLVQPRVLRVAKPKVIARPREQLTKGQRDDIIRRSAEHGRDAHLLFAVGLLAGLRRGELLALTWGQVQLDQQILFVRNSTTFTTKSGKPRAVPVCAALAHVLAQHRPGEVDPGAFVIAPHKAVRKGAMRWCFTKTFDRIAGEAGVAWLSPHAMRRCFATLGAQSGISVWKLRSWLGHASVKTTEGYTDDAERFDADVERLTA